MRKSAFALGLFYALVIGTIGTAQGSMDLGISIGDEGIESFHLAVGNYYRVPEREVKAVKKRKIREEEVPVVFFIATRAHVSADAVLKFRFQGESWMDISLRYGLGPEIFYVPVSSVKGPPYGKAYGHYKKRSKTKWKEIVLEDDDVVNLVNLKFISEHYGCSPEVVVEMRSSGKNFLVINDSVKRGKKSHSGNVNASKKHKGKGKGKK